MMRTRLHINRTQELAEIRALIESDRESARTVLIEAPESMGKSALLMELAERHSGEVVSAYVDLQQQPDVALVISAVATDLKANGIAVDRYDACRDEPPPPLSVTLKDLTVNRSSLSVLVDQHGDASDRNERLLNALAEDLRASGRRTLVLVDSYDTAAEACRRWLTGRFIPTLRAVPGVVQVIAGRQIPPVPPPRSAVLEIVLGPFRAANVAEWLDRMSAAYPADGLSTLANALCIWEHGVPGRIAAKLYTLQEGGWKDP